MLLNDLEISCWQLLVKLLKTVTQVPDPFLPLWSQLKSALGPAGNRSSLPWSWCITAWTITPPCQLLNSHTFFILTNRFLPLWNQRKRAGGPTGNRSSPFRLRAPQHHSDFSVLPNPLLSLLSQLTLLFLLTLGIDSRFENHSLDHYTTMAKCHGGVVVVFEAKGRGSSRSFTLVSGWKTSIR